MGKASKWFSNLFVCKRRRPLTSDSDFAKPLTNSDKHAIKVVDSEPAFSAADKVSRLVYKNVTVTQVQSGLTSYGLEKDAAVKIQSAFRGYLARKALRALKGLVRIQALWRGHFVRKQSTDMLRRLQALIRVQHRVLANRALNIESTHCSRENSTRYEIHARSARTEDLSVLKRIDSITSIKEPNWLQNWVEDGSLMKTFKVSNTNYHEKSDKILKIDNSNPRTRCLESSQQDVYNPSFATSDYLARYYPNAEEGSESARRSPKTPLRDNEGSRSLLSGNPSPNFMANTKSSRAKARCHSVPRQRQDQPSCKRSLHVLWELKTSLRRKSDSFF